ncbi:MAG: hypothetical protein AB7I30_18895, partial [Isosphaeraceae bacterium]
PDRNPSEKVNPAIGLDDFDSQEERTPVGRIFRNVEECDAHDPFVLVSRIPRDRLPHLVIDCGTEDPFLAVNQEFVDLLKVNKIAFHYAQSPGEHRSAYWRKAVTQALATQALTLGAARKGTEEPSQARAPDSTSANQGAKSR